MTVACPSPHAYPRSHRVRGRKSVQLRLLFVQFELAIGADLFIDERKEQSKYLVRVANKLLVNSNWSRVNLVCIAGQCLGSVQLCMSTNTPTVRARGIAYLRESNREMLLTGVCRRWGNLTC